MVHTSKAFGMQSPVVTSRGKQRRQPNIVRSCFLEQNLDHLVADTGRFGKSWRKVRLDLLKAIAVDGKIPESDAVGPALKQYPPMSGHA